MPETSLTQKTIFLTGLMGSGKSSVATVLARSLCLPLVDLDAMICKEAGKSINEIFADEGESAFRSLESACLNRAASFSPSVIATGGGVVIAESNRRLMHEKGIIINLTAPLALILERLSGATDRPLYSDQDAEKRIRTLMEEREQFYADADIRIDTDGKSVEDVAAYILKVLKGLHP
jgi:shikimate kinase